MQPICSQLLIPMCTGKPIEMAVLTSHLAALKMAYDEGICFVLCAVLMRTVLCNIYYLLLTVAVWWSQVSRSQLSLSRWATLTAACTAS